VRKYIFLFLFLSVQFDKLYGESIVTNGMVGLLGDQLLCYCAAKWISNIYKIPFLYTESNFFSGLLLHEVEPKLSESEKLFLQKKRLSGTISEDSFSQESSRLYQTFLPISDKSWIKYQDKVHNSIVNLLGLAETGHEGLSPKYKVDLQNVNKEQNIIQGSFASSFEGFYWAFRDSPHFINILRELIKPQKDLNFIELPSDYVTVAMHVRKGGRYEPLQNKIPNEISLRVPQDIFYLEQLNLLAEMLGDKTLYVFIFTNHEEPQKLVNLYKQAIDKPDIIFAARDFSSNSTNVLEDLFSMMKFDCLIRPASSLSMIAQLLGDHKIILYPRHGIWRNGVLMVDQIGMVINDKKIIEKKYLDFLDGKKLGEKCKEGYYA